MSFMHRASSRAQNPSQLGLYSSAGLQVLDLPVSLSASEALHIAFKMKNLRGGNTGLQVLPNAEAATYSIIKAQDGVYAAGVAGYVIDTIVNNEQLTGTIDCYLSVAGKFSCILDAASDTPHHYHSVLTKSDGAAVTSIRISTDGANGIGAGSVFQVWRMGQ